ncbi:hypothetical protein TRFO_10945 [Tritrichomonas foetus]|uniref:Uncharacterized protein n=1 Tax=Tritrichomonas foetus TaxID=1144522 RepID=A0A1J4J6B4_9EUKA|nr:hypothetical protein TRFO_10945 [Tritrichomonas foetus]|eukprot:OHS94766.1 hypothetical protein TRFO_10945 [Tritrichomonas foetus]
MLSFLLIGASLGLEVCVPTCDSEYQKKMTLAEITEKYAGKDINLLTIDFYDDANLDELKVRVTGPLTLLAHKGKLSGTLVSKSSPRVTISQTGEAASIKDLSVEMVSQLDNPISQPITLTHPIKKLSIDFGDLNKKDEYIPCYVAPEELEGLDFKSKSLGFSYKNPKKEKYEIELLKTLSNGPLDQEFYLFSYKQGASDGPNVGLIVGVVVAVVVVIVVVVVVVILVLRKKKNKDSGSNK